MSIYKRYSMKPSIRPREGYFVARKFQLQCGAHVEIGWHTGYGLHYYEIFDYRSERSCVLFGENLRSLLRTMRVELAKLRDPGFAGTLRAMGINQAPLGYKSIEAGRFWKFLDEVFKK